MIKTSTVSRENVLASFMGKVYMLLGIGLVVSFFVGYFLSTSKAFLVSAMPISLISFFVLIGISLFLSARIQYISLSTATILYLLYTSVFGVILPSIFLVYTGESILSVFMITAIIFFALGIYGYTTKRDLSVIGKFCFMGLLGLIVYGLASYFFPSLINGPLMMGYNLFSLLIFIGFTIYDHQKIKNLGSELLAAAADEETSVKYAIVCALKLFVDFINLFLSLLRIMGRRR